MMHTSQPELPEVTADPGKVMNIVSQYHRASKLPIFYCSNRARIEHNTVDVANTYEWNRQKLLYVSHPKLNSLPTATEQRMWLGFVVYKHMHTQGRSKLHDGGRETLPHMYREVP